MPLPMPLLGRVAIGTPDLWPMAIHQVTNDDGAAGRSGTMHDSLARSEHPLIGIRAFDGAAGRSGTMHDSLARSEHPLIGIRAFDTHTGLVGGDDLRLAQGRNGHVALGRERCLRPPQHIHQTALADRQPEEIGEGALQAFVGQSLEGLEIGRHGMDAGPERSAFRRIRQRRDDDHPARRASNRKAPVALDHWMDLGKFDGLVLACRLGGQVLRELGLATGALIRTVIDLPVERLAHGASLALMAGFSAARPGLVAPLLAICRRWLRRRPRRLLRSLQPQHQINQFVLR